MVRSICLSSLQVVDASSVGTEDGCSSQDFPQNFQEGRQPQHENHYSKHPFVRLSLPLNSEKLTMGPKVFLLKLQVTDSNWHAFSSPPKLCQRCRNGDPFVDLPATRRLGCMPRFSAFFQLLSIRIVAS